MALSDPRILQGLQNTLIIAVSAATFGHFLFPGRLRFGAHEASRARSARFDLLVAVGYSGRALRSRPALDVSRHPFFRPFYGTIVLLVIALVLGGITLSTQILKANFVQLGNELEEASRMSGAGFGAPTFKWSFPYGADHGVGGCA